MLDEDLKLKYMKRIEYQKKMGFVQKVIFKKMRQKIICMYAVQCKFNIKIQHLIFQQ